MRLLICGTCPDSDDPTREALARAFEAWQVSMVVCFGANPASDWCARLGMPARTLPHDEATLDTMGWLFGLGAIDRVLALPEGLPVDLCVQAFEHRVPVWEVTAGQPGRAELAPVSLGRARRRWLIPPMRMAG